MPFRSWITSFLCQQLPWKNRVQSFLLLGVFIFSGGCGSQHGIEIAADTNRDGKVEFQQDRLGKDQWTPERGALFFNNNDSDLDSHIPDHSDDVINGPNDLKDLAMLRIKRNSGLTEDTKIKISVDVSSRSRVRLFLRSQEDGNLSLLHPGDGRIDPSVIKERDLELRIEANSYADGSWGGETKVTLTVTPPKGDPQTDSVLLKVAPFILLSNLNTGKTLYVREFPGRNDSFLQSLRQLVPEAGANLNIVPAGDPYTPSHIWMQDTMEIGYSEIPGHRMNVVLKANRGKSLDEFARNGLLGPDFGWIEIGSLRKAYGSGRGGNGWLDWYGNLEVTPPVPGYPLGRIFYGYNPEGPDEASLNPAIVDMLSAQGVQAPLIRIDTGWLLIKHVDEVFSFLPTGNPEDPFKVLVADTSAMIGLLDKWMKEGYGNQRVFEPYEKEEVTVALLNNNKKLMDLNKKLQKDRIEPNIDLLKTELGLKEEDFIRIPSLIDEYGMAVVPNMVNSTVLNGDFYIVAPKGPKIEGKDLLEEEMRRLISGLPLKPHFLEAGLYHVWGGEVHCATNVRREGPESPWWLIK
ncbi:protein-arginine deiminase family protein [Acidobacteriota bacterium]